MQDNTFEQLMEEYMPLIGGMVKRLHIHKNKEDFIQVGRIALWKARQNFNESKGTFSSFAFSYVRGEMLTHLRRESTYEQQHTWLTDEAAEGIISTFSETPPEAEKSIEDYLHSLSNREKTWVIEAIIYGRTIQQISARYGVSSSTVKSWRKMALQKLKKECSTSPFSSLPLYIESERR